MELGDHDLGRVDTDGDRGTVVLLAGDALNVDNVLLTVALDNLTVTALEGTTDDLDLILLADRHRTDVVLLAELGGEHSAHDGSTSGRIGREVGLAGLAPGRADSCRKEKEKRNMGMQSVSESPSQNKKQPDKIPIPPLYHLSTHNELSQRRTP